jgi:hypothetical protein
LLSIVFFRVFDANRTEESMLVGHCHLSIISSFVWQWVVNIPLGLDGVMGGTALKARR